MNIAKMHGERDKEVKYSIFCFRSRLDSFGFRAIVVDGHDVEELSKAFAEVGGL